MSEKCQCNVFFSMVSMSRTEKDEVIDKRCVVDMPAPTYTKVVANNNVLSLNGIIFVDGGDDYLFPFRFKLEMIFEYKDQLIRTPKELYSEYKENCENKAISILKTNGGIIINNTITMHVEGIDSGK